MAFAAKDVVRSKVFTESTWIERISHFKCLGCDVSYELSHHKKQIYHLVECIAIKKNFG